MPTREARGVSTPTPQGSRRPASPSRNGSGRGAVELLGPPASLWRLRCLRSRRRTVLRDGAGRRHEVRLAELGESRLLYALVEGETALCLGVFRRGEGEDEASAEEAVVQEYARALADQRALAALDGPGSPAAGPRFLCRAVLRSDLEASTAQDEKSGGGRAAAAGR
jgi:hypothetical protein